MFSDRDSGWAKSSTEGAAIPLVPFGQRKTLRSGIRCHYSTLSVGRQRIVAEAYCDDQNLPLLVYDSWLANWKFKPLGCLQNPESTYIFF